MKKILLAIFLLLLLGSPLAIAQPPSDIELSFNQESKVLSIKVLHVSQRNRDHYIRRIWVYLNDQEVVKDGFAAQEPWGIAHDVKVEAKSGDVIRVVAKCSKAGETTQTLQIP